MSRPAWKSAVAACVFAGGLAVAVVSGIDLWRGARDNARVAALAAGKDLAVPHDDGGVAQAARGRFLIAHGKLDQAQTIPDRMISGDPAARASLLYALANAHMRRALDSFKTDPMRLVAPIINQAKSEYRQALQIDPQNWDARYNYDIAAALVRDADSAPPAKGDEMARERALWPNVPGAPNGLP